MKPSCTRSSTPRSSAAHRTSSETNSPSNTLLAAVRKNSPRAHSASAFPAECAPTRSAAPHTKLGNADWLTPARCRSGLPRADRARPRSRPTLASLSDWQSSYPLPRPNTPACTHRPRSTRGSLVRTLPRRAGNPAPTPGSPPSKLATAVQHAVSPVLPPDHQPGLPIRCTRLWFTCSPERSSKTCSRRYPKSRNRHRHSGGPLKAYSARIWAEGGRRGVRGGRVQAHDLRLESEVRWPGCEPGALPCACSSTYTVPLSFERPPNF